MGKIFLVGKVGMILYQRNKDQLHFLARNCKAYYRHCEMGFATWLYFPAFFLKRKREEGSSNKQQGKIIGNSPLSDN